MNQFAGEVSSDVMVRVTRERKQKGMSAQDLATACTAAGFPMARNVVANLESGRRTSLTVAELAAFSSVLDVPLLVLLFDLEALDADSPLFLPADRPRSNLEGVQRAQSVHPGQSDEHSTILETVRDLAKYESELLRAVARLEQIEEDAQSLPDKAFREKHIGQSPETVIKSAKESAHYFGAESITLRGLLQPLHMNGDVRAAYVAAGFHELVQLLEADNPDALDEFHAQASRARHPGRNPEAVRRWARGDD